MKRLKASDHERRKAGELVAHAWDALPSVNARREAVVTTGRAFLAAQAAYAPDAVYPEDQHRVGRLAALAPHVATDVNGLARAPRRPEAGLRIFREDSVTPHGAFPDDDGRGCRRRVRRAARRSPAAPLGVARPVTPSDRLTH